MRRFAGVCLVAFGATVLVGVIAYLLADPSLSTVKSTTVPARVTVPVVSPRIGEIAPIIYRESKQPICADAKAIANAQGITKPIKKWLKRGNCYVPMQALAALESDLAKIWVLSATPSKQTIPVSVTYPAPSGDVPDRAWVWIATPATLSIIAFGLLLLWPRQSEPIGPEPKKKIERDLEQERFKKPDPIVPPAPVPAVTSAFQIEAMVSAGPRKSPADYNDPSKYTPDLGEDAAGVTTLNNAQIWWLCDGTGDGDFVPPVTGQPGLSTRMFARDLGEYFAQWVSAGAPLDSNSANQPLMFATLAHHWQTRIDAHLAAREAEGTLAKFFDEGDTGRLGGFTLKWSSTLLGGVLWRGARGEDILAIYQAGDCGALIARGGSQPGIELVLPNNHRVVVQATFTRSPAIRAEVKVFSIGNRIDQRQFQDVEGFAAMSDGLIAGNLTQYLAQLKERLSHLPIEKIGAGLKSRADKSRDDKSLIVGRRVRP